MRTPVTVTRYAVIHRDDATWTAIDDRASESSLDGARLTAKYWSDMESPYAIIRIDATLTDVTENEDESP